MVRFADIIKIRDDDELGGKPPALQPEGDMIVLGEDHSQPLRVEEVKISSGPPPRENARLETITYYEKFIESAINVRDRVLNKQGISPSPILADLHYIIENSLVDELYRYTMSASEDYEDRLTHTIAETFTSLKVGKGMGYDVKMLLKLGLAGFLENVGMYQIPESILQKKARLEPAEIEAIREHPKKSFEILAQMGERYNWLTEVALQVHERTDGSGYPRGLKGTEIDEIASILGLVDTYTAMIRVRPYRNKFNPTEAIKFTINEGRDLFPSRILKVFLNQISLFPVSTYVRLNNKSIGRVLSTDHNRPLRPTIELLYDGQGNKLQATEVISLFENPLLYVMESIDEEDLS
jgi:HD-GYP domain-containing protein (c-di-GMP phosphodiesterase class II)